MPSEEKLERQSYVSTVSQLERDYFVFLPRGYDDDKQKVWPVMLFLHGNGDRGNGKDELDYVLKNGPLYEAWIQKKDIPFIIIAPQLHMFGFDQKGIDYIDNRSPAEIPRRQADGVPPRPPRFGAPQALQRQASVSDMSEMAPLLPMGWDKLEADLLAMLDAVHENYRTNPEHTVLTGLSYGGFGTWYLASRHPDRFGAIAPVVGWGHPDLMAPIAESRLPLWAFAGGRDGAVNIQHFYAGLQKLEDLGHPDVRFTVYEEYGHDAWVRVYASDDLYRWLLDPATVP